MEGGSDELEKVRGLCGAFDGWRRALVLDPSASLGMTTSARVDRAWMERAGLKPAPTRGCVVSWGRAVREPLLRGVVLRIGESFGRDWVQPGTSGFRPAPV